jgi:hypothetical protein
LKAFDQSLGVRAAETGDSAGNAAVPDMRPRREVPPDAESSACENEKIILFSSKNGICNLLLTLPPNGWSV